MERKRRSGRVAKELEIVLLGTDTTGKVFAEQTKTVVLSRHGAGIISYYRFTPDEVLTLRLPDSNKEAEVRLVGQIGGEPGRYVYGVAFVDPDPHFWAMDFPPPEEFERARSIALECSRCQVRQTVEHLEIEEDVYSVNGYVLRFCAECGTSTEWKKAEGDAAPTPATGLQNPTLVFPESRPTAVPSSNAAVAKTSLTAPPPGASRLDPDLFAPSLAAPLRPTLAKPRGVAPAEFTSSYSGASATSEFASLAEVQVSPSVASATAVLPSPEFAQASRSSTAARSAAKPLSPSVRELDANGRRINKRRHVRISVSFGACVRQSGHADEVVECENVSKGGVCFHSVQQYELGTTIEVAAPYSPGETALFVPAQIKRIEPLSGGQVFRYGVEYLLSFSSTNRPQSA
jgi:hypothetical protein